MRCLSAAPSWLGLRRDGHGVQVAGGDGVAWCRAGGTAVPASHSLSLHVGGMHVCGAWGLEMWCSPGAVFCALLMGQPCPCCAAGLREVSALLGGIWDVRWSFRQLGLRFQPLCPMCS